MLTIGEAAVKEGDLVVLGAQASGAAITTATASALLVLSGEPLDEPVVGYGPFVMNTDAEIKQAFADYKMGKFGSFE